MPRYSDIIDRYNRAEWRWGLVVGFIVGAPTGAVTLLVWLVLHGHLA